MLLQVLTGESEDAPTIKELKSGCIAADTGLITAGSKLVAVNGELCLGHEHATQLLKSAIGDVVAEQILGERRPSPSRSATLTPV